MLVITVKMATNQMVFKNYNKNSTEWCHRYNFRTIQQYLKNNFAYRHICPVYRDSVSMQNFDLVELPVNIVQLGSYFARIFFLFIGTKCGGKTITF